MGFDNNLFSYKKTAEIVILDEKKKWKFTKKDSIKSNSLNSPFIGEELIGRIEFSISKNQIYSRSQARYINYNYNY